MKSLVLCLGICVSILSTPVIAQWQLRALSGANVHSLRTNGTLTYGGTEASGFHVSTDDGASWTQQNNGLTSNFVKTFAVSGSNLFAGTNGPAGAYMTTNNGANWSIANSGLTNTAVHALALNGGTLLAGTNGGGVFISTNNGGTWLASNTGLTTLSVHGLLVAGGRVFAGTGSASTEGGVFLSIDNGASWSRPATSPNNIRSLAALGTDIFASTNGTGVYRSTDNGATWAAVNTGLTTQTVRTIISQGGALFAGTNGGGVYLSTNSGTNWLQINTGLTSLSILCLAANSTTLYAGTQTGGIWTRPLSQVVAVNEQPIGQPAGFTLAQNYPNPFNPATIISYQLATNGFVTLMVFDVLGNEVATLVNGNVEAGVHVVQFDARSLASGFYTYRLTAGGTTLTKNMLLMK